MNVRGERNGPVEGDSDQRGRGDLRAI
uniref:Uncharacterized protein n=1 Tax=Rhizophora mucronata TaxID=61149 RepID=A0A2P2R1H1_RHIMU